MGMAHYKGHYFDIGMYDYCDYTDKWNAVCECNNDYSLITDGGERVITSACTMTFDDESYAGEITLRLSRAGELSVIDTQLLDDSDNEILDLHADNREIIFTAILNNAKCDSDLKSFILDLMPKQ